MALKFYFEIFTFRPFTYLHVGIVSLSGWMCAKNMNTLIFTYIVILWFHGLHKILRHFKNVLMTFDGEESSEVLKILK